MSFPHASRQPGWLQALIRDKGSRVKDLLNEIAALGVPGLMKPSIFRKFLDLLSQLATERDKEHALLSRVEAMEERHHFFRDHHKLEKADPSFEPKPDFGDDSDDDLNPDFQKQSSRKRLRWLFNLFPKPKGKENCDG